MDYRDIIFDYPSNGTFSSKTDSVQHNAALAIAGAIRGLSCEKFYRELGLEYLHHRHWMRRYAFFTMLSNKITKYIYELIPPIKHSFRNPNCRSEYFKNSFYPCVINYWNKLDPKMHNLTSYLSFRKFH